MYIYIYIYIHIYTYVYKAPCAGQVFHFWARATVGRNHLMEIGKMLVAAKADVEAIDMYVCMYVCMCIYIYIYVYV